jgi:xylulokinase
MILVLNLGLKSIRAVVFDEEGRKRRIASRPVPTFLKTGEVEQDADEWWTTGLTVMREVLQDRDVRRTVRAVTVTTNAGRLRAVRFAAALMTVSCCRSSTARRP